MPVPSPHDEFFKEIFGDLDRARDFLRDTLPPDLRDLLDLSNLHRESESFLSAELAETYADLVYSCPLEHSTALVAVLLEHKSWAPKHPHLQLLAYMLSIWQYAEKQGNPLPVVIPLVLYQGRKKWRVYTFYQSFAEIPERLRGFLPNFQFLLLDLARTPANRLRDTYSNRSVLVALELMKVIFSPKEVATLLERLSPNDGPIDSDLALRFLRVVLRYIFTRSDVGRQQALSSRLHPAIREVTMTLEQRILQIGKEQGLQQGLEQGLEKGLRLARLTDARKLLAEGCSWDFITRINGIRPEDLGAEDAALG